MSVKEKEESKRKMEKAKKRRTQDLNKELQLVHMSALLHLWIMICQSQLIIYSTKVDPLVLLLSPTTTTIPTSLFHNFAQILIPLVCELIPFQKLVSEKDWALHEFGMCVELGQSSCFHNQRNLHYNYCYHLRQWVWQMGYVTYHYSVDEHYSLHWNTHCCFHRQS